MLLLAQKFKVDSGFCFGILLILMLYSCDVNTNHQTLLQEVNQTSDLIHCDKIFSTDRKSIIELNQILIQTGLLDTSDNPSKYVAIIHVRNRELILDRAFYKKINNIITEKYTGKGYTLMLNFKPLKIQRVIDFEGSFKLTDGKETTSSYLYGVKNML